VPTTLPGAIDEVGQRGCRYALPRARLTAGVASCYPGRPDS
jgi:hypothetical protein